MGRLAKQPIKVVWAGKGTVCKEYNLAVFFDENSRIDRVFTDFMRWFAHQGTGQTTNRHTYRRTVTAMKFFRQFLADKGISWREFDEGKFVEFKQREFDAAKQRQKREDEPAAKENLNFWMETIYEFYEWAQEDRGLITGHIGIGCPIHTILRRNRTIADKSKKNRGPVRKAASYRPLLFKRSKRMPPRYFATEEETKKLASNLRNAAKDPYKAARDYLLVHLLWETLFRIDSVASLTVDDFPQTLDELRKMKSNAVIYVCPARQKNGAQRSYAVSRDVAIDVRKYIEGPRAELLKRLGLVLDDEDNHENGEIDRALLLSLRYPKKPQAMTTKALATIVEDGLADMGIAARRVGSHGLRRGHADIIVMEILRERMAITGDIPPEEDVLQELSDILGHSSQSAREHYHRAIRLLREETPESYVHRGREEVSIGRMSIEAREAAMDIERRQWQEEKEALLLQIEQLEYEKAELERRLAVETEPFA